MERGISDFFYCSAEEDGKRRDKMVDSKVPSHLLHASDILVFLSINEYTLEKMIEYEFYSHAEKKKFKRNMIVEYVFYSPALNTRLFSILLSSDLYEIDFIESLTLLAGTVGQYGK
jgi:hypothetical protein